MHARIRIKTLIAGAALAAMGLTGTALAQTFPAKPVTLMVPYPAGGLSDVIARSVNNTLGKQLGQLEAAGFAGAAFMDKDEVKVFSAQ